MMVLLLINLVVYRPLNSATFTNLVPEYSLVFLGNMLERGVTTFGTISTLASGGFADDGVDLSTRSTSSKER